MDIFLFFKNVQNEKPRMNLEWPFFGDTKFGKIMLCKNKKTEQIFIYI